jgi:hypothetical protein
MTMNTTPATIAKIGHVGFAWISERPGRLIFRPR